jgi:dihydrofolate synthase/folylpolyglutamate synthase
MTRRSLDEWLTLQQSVHPRGIDLTLARVAEVAARLDLTPPRHPVITVAGTNGKGSTVDYCARMLTAAGHRCGAFTSPHLLRYNERIRIDGAMAADAELVASFEAIEAARGSITLTYFEYNALAALWTFREREVDVAVLEVGLGGRLDAVNIVDADVAIVCSIGIDHRDWLGDTLEAIGREKAGVFRAHRPAVLADADMTPVVAEEARRVGARVHWAGRDYAFTHGAPTWSLRFGTRRWDDLPVPALVGDVQYANAAGAIVAVSCLPLEVPDAAVRRALREARVPGRFQRVPGEVEWILDVAHNEAAAHALAAQLARMPCRGRRYTVAGILGDKDVDAVARELSTVTDTWILCGIDDPRGLAPAQLAARSPFFADALLADDVAAGVARARELARPGDRVVVCGSFLAVAPALAALGASIADLY